MSEVVSESISVDKGDPTFVRIVLEQMRDSGVDMGGQLFVERAHVAWIVEHLDKALTTYGDEGYEAALGDDKLRVFESGHEQAPFFNVHCRRPEGAVHGGMYALAMTRPAAEKLLADLRSI